MKVISLSGVFLPGGHETFPTDPGVEKIFSITSGWSMKLMMHISPRHLRQISGRFHKFFRMKEDRRSLIP
jgi:hypothetical protein